MRYVAIVQELGSVTVRKPRFAKFESDEAQPFADMEAMQYFIHTIDVDKNHYVIINLDDLPTDAIIGAIDGSGMLYLTHVDGS